jgi:hypothetical protein
MDAEGDNLLTAPHITMAALESARVTFTRQIAAAYAVIDDSSTPAIPTDLKQIKLEQGLLD